MNTFTTKTLLVAAAVGLLAACASEVPGEIDDRAQDDLALIARHPTKALCDAVGPGQRRCHARIRMTDDGLKPYASSTPSGFGPPDLISAYNLAGAPSGAGQTVAIVDANDDPNAESDLAVYRSHYGLPACTTANGCFKKISQTGTTTYPTADSGWAGEISLDLDMVSAICPACNILLVEASSADDADLGAAVNEAAKLGATAISNSYGGAEDSTVTTQDTTYFNHPGILITASSGDNGYGASYPATSKYVLAVGGTSLVKSSTGARGWSETAWSSGGAGCSAYIAKPSYQKDPTCTMRMEADVAAVADPNTGVATYDTYGGASAGATGWVQVGGTSASSPIIASMFTRLGIAGQAAQTAGWPYAHTSAFYDVTSGSTSGGPSGYEGTAQPGYDGPTGIGTPNAAAILTAAGGSAGGSGGGSAGGSAGGSGGGSGGGSAGGSGGGSAGGSGGGSAGGSGGGSAGGSGGGSAGGSGGSCSHSICTTGTELTTSCDPCAAKVCAQDSYCCTTAWDSTCTGEVQSICAETCGGSGGGSGGGAGGGSAGGSAGGSGGGSAGGGGTNTCTHSECSSGKKLTSSCSTCASTVCESDSYCCDTKWDAVCVSEAKSECAAGSLSCN